MTDIIARRLNERVKVISGAFVNLGTALLAATAAKLYSYPVIDIAVVIWSIGVFALTYVGWSVLALLEPEE